MEIQKDIDPQETREWRDALSAVLEIEGPDRAHFLIEQWIEVGLPDERELRKACGRAREVHVLAYGGRAVELWWLAARDRFERQDRLAVAEVPHETSRALAQLAARSMQLQVTVQDGHIFVADGESSVPVELAIRKALVR